MTSTFFEILFVLVAYLIGCLNFGYYIVKRYTGKDIRSSFSGNAGATNAGRMLGKKGFAYVFAGDFIKGALVLFTAHYLHVNDLVQLSSIAACVLGHIYPAQLHFRGGKGLSTLAGCVLGYDPRIFFIAALVLLLTLLLSRNKLYATMTGILSFGIIAYIFNKEFTSLLLLLFSSFLVIYKHRQDLVLSLKNTANGN